jgi:hypothetical protein
MFRRLVGPGVVATLLLMPQGAGGTASGYRARLAVFPQNPRAGRLATIQLRPYTTLVESTEPSVVPAGFRWRLMITAGRGRHYALSPSRSATNPYLWQARFRFPSRGLWQIKALADSAGPQLLVRVRRPGPLGSWARLERPLRTPSIPRGAPCPTSSPDPKGDLSRLGFAGTAWGSGPAYPGGLTEAAKPVLRYQDPIPPQSGFYGSKWFGNKVLWMFDRGAYHGPILIRGRQVDGMNELGFEFGRLPPSEMRVEPRNARPSFTRVRAAGCYAYQVDGTTFTALIVFEAKPF